MSISSSGSPLISSLTSFKSPQSVTKTALADDSGEAILRRALSVLHERIGAQLEAKGITGKTVAFEPLSAEQAASNILGFIERRLAMDVAEGATEEQLRSRLDAALAGFEKGFTEASERLSALSRLYPAIASEIGETYDRVIDGLDRLRLQLLPEPVSVEPDPESALLKLISPQGETITSQLERKIDIRS